ncbi:hypothetical protein BJ875DRAFT_376913 [Amylocarpus encephaloides]|uniref:Uncharacterized protein n=1 Tax=Amylocarpus encephaloides TaxID=45428 RepID=A0A9P8C555_9HELO|nr:hypothetical protein BJ875DRAFT_376913 [Amylocarpus encephaloides]
MADWEPQRQGPSSRWPAPGVFVNVEFGVSFSPKDPPHMASMKYTSRNMQERMLRRQQEELRCLGTHSRVSGWQEWERRQQREQQQRQRRDEQERPRRLGVSEQGHRERGVSAPPSAATWNQIVSPVSPLSTFRNSIATLESRDRPLPPVPSRFRLGDDDMPWSMPAWYRSQEPEQTASAMGGIDFELSQMPRGREEDPQRVRELEDLHQAMMTVDSLDSVDLDDEWNRETSTWSRIEEAPRAPAPRSVGWAVSRTEEVPDLYASNHLDRLEQPPPPYVVSQWESTL